MKMASIQFVINAPHSGGSVGITDQQRRAANAHAARMRHAKERRLRMKEYHSRSGGVSDDQRLVLKSGSSERMNACRPQIFSLLSADRRDPFMSSVVALNPIEQGLFDHCKSFCSLSSLWASCDVLIIVRYQCHYPAYALHRSGPCFCEPYENALGSLCNCRRESYESYLSCLVPTSSDNT